MSVERALIKIEEQLWKNDAKLYYDSLTDEALLVFPETGAIGREAAIEAIRDENAGASAGPKSASRRFAPWSCRRTWRC